MAVVFTVWILVLLMTQSFCEEYELEIRMPTVSPPKDGAYLCTALNVTQNSDLYITKFIPHAEVNTTGDRGTVIDCWELEE
ncbi:peptidyl-glycine alpha-amidating monooxygenase A-like [Saccoglossus kowalevskii]